MPTETESRIGPAVIVAIIGEHVETPRAGRYKRFGDLTWAGDVPADWPVPQGKMPPGKKGGVS